MMRAKQKLKSRSGFTLAETLLAILILLLVSLIVANGIPVAKNVYDKVIIGSNAQLLLSTTVRALRDELTLARDVQCPDGKTITYYSDKISAMAMIKAEEYKGKNAITFTPYIDPITRAVVGDTTRDLVSSAAATESLYVTYGGVAFDAENSIVTFTDLKVYKEKENTVMASLGENSTLQIRVFSAD